MAKLDPRLMDIDLDVVVDGEGHALMRDGEDQTFGGNKTFDTPTRSWKDKPETKNTAVNKMMLYNATRCTNTPFEELLIVREEDIANGYIMLGKEMPEGRESSLEIVNFEGAPTLVNGVEFGAEIDRIVFTGYPIERFIAVEDRIEVRYAVCGPEMSLLEGIQKVVYSPTLRRFVAVCNTGMWWSDDGANWTLGTGYAYEGDSRASYWVPEIGRFVSFFFDGGRHLYSDDGKTWKTTDSGAELLQGASVSSVKVGDYNNTNYLGDAGYYRITVDGVTWVGPTYSTHEFTGGFTSLSGSYDGEDFGTIISSVWDKGNDRFIQVENLYSHHAVAWGEQRVYTESEENGITYIGMPPTIDPFKGDAYVMETIFVTPRFCILWGEHRTRYEYSTEEGEIWEGYDVVAVSNSRLKKWTAYRRNSDIPTPVMYCSGINAVIGVMEVAGRHMWVVTRNGIVWGLIRDWEAKGTLCWAENQNMFLEYGGDWIKARKFAVTDIINGLQMSIPEPDTIIYLEGGGSGGDPDPGGDPGGGSGYGDDDPGIDPNEDPRFKDRGEYLEYTPNFGEGGGSGGLPPSTGGE